MWRRTGSITALILILVTVGQGVLEYTRQETMAPGEYYVSPTGSDENAGSLEAPWRTVAFGLSELSAGDILYLREGTYYEHEIEIRASGTISAPIMIQSYPGERAIIDGGISTFRERPNSEWEMVDEALGLYRSRRWFEAGFDVVRAWLVDDGVQLVEYGSAENMESTNYGPMNGLEPVYMGPGLQMRRDGRVYIRLAYNPYDLIDRTGDRRAPTPVNVDPNANSLAISFSRYLFRLDGASYIRFQDLEFAHADYIMDARNDSHHVVLSGCRVTYCRYGLVLREGVHDWEITGCEFNGGVPDYVYWTDVKNRGRNPTEAYPEFQSVAISGALSGFVIHHNVFRNVFDGITVQEGSANTRIVENVFRQARDDALNLSRGISNVEVAHNMLWRVMSGISNLGSDLAPGHVYIHHNVIDNSAYQRGGRPGNFRQDNWPIWTIGSPFPDHDDGNKASWWKLYNNTVVTRQDAGHRWSAAGPDSVTGNPEKVVLNNIFYVLGDRVVFRDDLLSLGSHYDGNVFFQSADDGLPLFTNFGDRGRYYSLLDFAANAGTQWEAQGLEVDPGFDVSTINDPVFDAEWMWERYRPQNSQVYAAGAAYDGLEWPGTEAVDYRGAVPPP